MIDTDQADQQHSKKTLGLVRQYTGNYFGSLENVVVSWECNSPVLTLCIESLENVSIWQSNYCMFLLLPFICIFIFKIFKEIYLGNF